MNMMYFFLYLFPFLFLCFFLFFIFSLSSSLFFLFLSIILVHTHRKLYRVPVCCPFFRCRIGMTYLEHLLSHFNCKYSKESCYLIVQLYSVIIYRPIFNTFVNCEAINPSFSFFFFISNIKILCARRSTRRRVYGRT